MKILATTLLSLIALQGCSAESIGSDTNEIVISLAGNGKAYLYVESKIVKYEKCLIERKGTPTGKVTEEGKYCENLEFDPVPLDFIRYRDALAIAYGVDAQIVVGGIESYEATITRLKKRKTEEEENPDSSARKLTLIDEKLARYEGIRDEVERLFHFVGHLEDGRSIELDEDIDEEDIKRLVAPFYGRLQSSAEGFKESPETGLVYVQEPEICWYDAMGINYRMPCLSNEKGDVFVATSHDRWTHDAYLIITADLMEIPRQPSCSTKYGKGWQVATPEQLQQLIYRENSIRLPKFAANGKIFQTGWSGASRNFDNVLHQEHDKQLGTYSGVLAIGGDGENYEGGRHDFSDHNVLPRERSKSLALGVVCVSTAKSANPYGDIDKDGIPNLSDMCNRYPKHIDEQPAESGDRIGCTENQTPDSELDFLAGADVDEIIRSEVRASTQFEELESKFTQALIRNDVELRKQLKGVFERLFGAGHAEDKVSAVANGSLSRGYYVDAVIDKPNLIADLDQVLNLIKAARPTPEEAMFSARTLLSAENIAVAAVEHNPRRKLAALLNMSEDSVEEISRHYDEESQFAEELKRQLVEQAYKLPDMKAAITIFNAYKNRLTGEPLARCEPDSCAEHVTPHKVNNSPRYEERSQLYRCAKPGLNGNPVYASNLIRKSGTYDYFLTFVDGTHGSWIKGTVSFSTECPDGFHMVLYKPELTRGTYRRSWNNGY